MKKVIITLFLLLISIASPAVLREKDLVQTLSILRLELEDAYKEKIQQQEEFNKNSGMMKKRMMQSIETANQVALMLYSQKMDYTFDLTYACGQATDLYRNFTQNSMPFDLFATKLDMEIERYTELIKNLQTIPVFLINSQVELNNKNQCIELAQKILDITQKQRQMLTTAMERHKASKARLKEMNDYANERYGQLRNNIFVNGDMSYPQIIAFWPRYISRAKYIIESKYFSRENIKSEWSGPVYFFLLVFTIFYIFLASGISTLVVNRFVPQSIRNTDDFKQKKLCHTLAFSFITFAGVLALLRAFVLKHNFILMASGLLMEYAWMMAAILVSLLVRVNGSNAKRAFRFYTPVMVTGFIVIVFRIMFIPNDLVNLLFPPMLIACTVWQFFALRNNWHHLPKYDLFYGTITLIIMVLSSFSSWMGFVLLSVQALIWWIFQLTCIQSITCIYDILGTIEQRIIARRIKRNGGNMNNKEKGYYIRQTWFFDFVCMALTPALGVFSVMFSLWSAAKVFDITAWMDHIFFTPFLNVENLATLSIFRIVMVFSLFFVFRYFNYLFKSLYTTSVRKRNSEQRIQVTLGRNLLGLLTWGTYIIVSMTICHVNKSGIAIISAGLSTGVGFAMKDLIENFFYGMSLMTGRVRVGDIIECDGIRGRVESITYQSTQVHTFDGSVISFLNSQLFTKNFKNLTQNHKYEKISIPVGIAYGANVQKVRDLLIHDLSQLLVGQKSKGDKTLIDEKYGVVVAFMDFGDSSVNLSVFFWMLVDEEIKWLCRVRETIYNCLNDNHIEIPFPQQDIYLRSVPQDFLMAEAGKMPVEHSAPSPVTPDDPEDDNA